jgi:hypothetical protein
MPASRSLIALLVGTVAFFALWVFALKGSSSSSSSSQGVGQYQSAINKAHQAVQISNASNAASGNDAAQPSSPASSSGAKPTTASPTKTKPAVHLTAKVGSHNKASVARVSTVQQAIKAHKVVAMLFYNPTGADDVAVKKEFAAVSRHRGRVVKLTIPLGEAANFTQVTQQVPVNFSPTLVLIAPSGQADEIVGFSDQFEIAQRVDDALATR